MLAVEPETAAPFARSFQLGRPVAFEVSFLQNLCSHWVSVLPQGWKSSFVDGCGGRAVLQEIWEVGRGALSGGLTVSLEQVAGAVRQLALHNKVDTGLLAVVSTIYLTR